ncbi:unnamed protein product, partial [Citrullus colocynthis]
SINGVIDDVDELNISTTEEEEDSCVIPHVNTGVSDIPSNMSADMQPKISRENNMVATEEAKASNKQPSNRVRTNHHSIIGELLE